MSHALQRTQYGLLSQDVMTLPVVCGGSIIIQWTDAASSEKKKNFAFIEELCRVKTSSRAMGY
jgi:hypothetical protein